MATALLGSTGESRIRDGRRITYATLGQPGGFPILYLHGAIGSPRWRTPELDGLILEYGLRYVVVNRPGFAGSDPDPERSVASFASDVRDLVDQFGFERFAVLGVSAGAPYALACGWAMPERIVAVASVSPLPAAAGPGASVGLRYQAPLLAFGTPGLGFPAASCVLRLLGLRSSTGARAMIDDYEVCRRPWGLDPGEIATSVILSHGTRDRLVPFAHALRLADAIPDCQICTLPGAGHFFLSRHLRDVIAPLAVRAGPAQTPTRLRVAA